jgi:hypothetical protein
MPLEVLECNAQRDSEHAACFGAAAAEQLDPALACIASLQLLGCDADTLGAYEGAARFGIHLDDLCDVPDPSDVQARARRIACFGAHALLCHWQQFLPCLYVPSHATHCRGWRLSAACAEELWDTDGSFWV